MNNIVERLRSKMMKEFGIDALGNDAADEIEWLKAENDLLRSQLPEGMEHCTIQFKKCEAGHGRLTAKNWIDNGCPWCEIERLKAERAEV